MQSWLLFDLLVAKLQIKKDMPYSGFRDLGFRVEGSGFSRPPSDLGSVSGLEVIKALGLGIVELGPKPLSSKPRVHNPKP